MLNLRVLGDNNVYFGKITFDADPGAWPPPIGLAWWRKWIGRDISKELYSPNSRWKRSDVCLNSWDQAALGCTTPNFAGKRLTERVEWCLGG